MSVFFQLIAVFALFFGIAGIVYGTEVSKRCQQQISDRLSDIEKKLNRRANQHESMIKRVITSVHETMAKLEETELSQSREIVAIRNTLKPLLVDLEKRLELEKKWKRCKKFAARLDGKLARLRLEFIARLEHPHAAQP